MSITGRGRTAERSAGGRAARGRVRGRSSTSERRGSGRLLWIAALLGVFALPVEYRGGAELPHAHAALQLWSDAADGAFDHHADSHRHRVEGGEADASPAGHGWAATSIVPAGDPDAPQLSPLTLSADRVPLLVAGIVLSVPPLHRRRRAAWSPAAVLRGAPPRPETPPPRPRFAPV